MQWFKKVFLGLILLGFAAYAFYGLRDKVVFVANQTTIAPSSVKSYMLSLYARYQLQPDTSNLKYSLNLLLRSESLSKNNQQAVQAMLDYLEQQKSYSEVTVLTKLNALRPLKIKHDLSFMGLNFSGIVREKTTSEHLAQQIIHHARWALLTHNNVIFQTEIAKLTGKVDNKEVLKELRAYNVDLPLIPWLKWLEQLSDKD